LDFKSKLGSAKAMSWIENTTLAQTMENEGAEKPVTTPKTKGLDNSQTTFSSKSKKKGK
jgi:hypothetical protein